MLQVLPFINVADIAKEFGITQDRIRTLSREKRLTRYYFNDRYFVIEKDNKYKELKKHYEQKNKIRRT